MNEQTSKNIADAMFETDKALHVSIESIILKAFNDGNRERKDIVRITGFSTHVVKYRLRLLCESGKIEIKTRDAVYGKVATEGRKALKGAWK